MKLKDVVDDDGDEIAKINFMQEINDVKPNADAGGVDRVDDHDSPHVAVLFFLFVGRSSS